MQHFILTELSIRIKGLKDLQDLVLNLCVYRRYGTAIKLSSRFNFKAQCNVLGSIQQV